MKKLDLLYEGKAKKVYTTDDADVLIVDYKDDATAFNGEKKGTIVGKGVIKELRYANPKANIIAVDYDPGASEVNQLNRIKLMLSTAQKNLEKEEYVDPNLAKTLKKVEELSSKRVNKCRL